VASIERREPRLRASARDVRPEMASRRHHCRGTPPLGKRWRPTPREQQPPQGLVDLLDRLWVSLDWSGAFQLTLIIIGIGIIAALGLSSLILFAHLAAHQFRRPASMMLLAGGVSTLAVRGYIRRR
jgi:hypothetical protein